MNWCSKGGYNPALTVIRLPNDHTGKERPDDGYPYESSFGADNDLALGKIVDTISHSAIWNDAAIFVIEDDSQSGVDHVDAHRSPVLIISPYTKRGYISHRTPASPVYRRRFTNCLALDRSTWRMRSRPI